ncbi:MAG TPA: hypothetical protein VHL31_07365, partial [Geminicoccus sp.]|uniref:hypothetical protein n=1 Tax=Geminicoccus sp. TaxID=2024832 RepID=UPI002E34148A
MASRPGAPDDCDHPSSTIRAIAGGRRCCFRKSLSEAVVRIGKSPGASLLVGSAARQEHLGYVLPT